MEQATEAKTYRSPAYKLLGFFRRSRDGWKRKAKDRNVRIKRLENRVAGLKDSRRKWKEKAQGQQAEIARLTKELDEQKGAPV
jgi:seryl-tRNA synthetase